MRLDRAVAFGLLQVLARGAAGLGTALLVSAFLGPAEQGYYFTFSSLLALQCLAELGMPLVLLQFAAHEWGRGSRAGLSGLLRLGDRWFSWAAVLSTAAMLTAGTAFLAEPRTTVSWLAPWLALAALGGARMALTPRVVVLEACGRVADVQRFRLVEALLAAGAAWASLAAGAGLWTPVAAAATATACLAAFLHGHRRFFQEIAAEPDADWRAELWPMQWRVALGAVAGHLAFSVLTPAVFHTQGAVEAGRMGLTWALACGFRDLGSAWLAAGAPDFAAQIARGEIDLLDAAFRRTVAASTAALLVLALLAWTALAALGSSRFLPPVPTALLLVGHVLFHLTACLATWLRAHRQEPLLGVSLAMAVMVVGGTALAGGPADCAAAFAIAQALTLAYAFGVWTRCRREWHGRIPAGAPRTTAP